MSDVRAQLQTYLADRYTLEAELSGGGMSRVFVAEETALHRRVVIKVLPPDLAASVNVDRFRREILVAARLQHPHIVPLLAAGETGGLLYYVMPFIEGESLRALLVQSEPLPLDLALGILRDIAAALECAHAAGLVHRDIKPENVLLSHGFAVVTDFGVAKALGAAVDPRTGGASGGLTSVGLTLGTPAYMAPEQIAADPDIDQRADLYAFGVLAYELLSGRTPFAGRQLQSMLAAHLAEMPRPLHDQRPEIPAALSDIVMHCLAKLPTDRPQSAGDVRSRLEALGNASSDRPSTTGDALPSEATRSSRVAHQSWWLLAALLLLGVTLVTYRLTPKARDQGSTRGAPASAISATATSAAATTMPEHSVVVLPLANVGTDTAGVYFSDGMTDELRSALGKVPGLRVVAGSGAVRGAQGKAIDPRDLGSRLRVASALSGSVHHIGDRSRLTIDLVSTVDGRTIWSETYPLDMRRAESVFQLEDQIVRAVIDKLQIGAPGSRELPARDRRSSANPDAYALYLRGRYLAGWRGAGGGAGKAVGYFQRAIALDPGYAAAYAGMASAYVAQGLGNSADFPPNAVMPLARAAAVKALSLDNTLADAHTALGMVMEIYDFDWIGAERELTEAAALDPTFSSAHVYHAVLFEWLGRFDDAVSEANRAMEDDPLDPGSNAELGRTLFFARRYAQATAQLRKTIELDSTYFRTFVVLGELFEHQGMFDSADAYMRKALRRTPNSSGVLSTRMLSFGAQAAALAGRKAEALQVLDSLQHLRDADRYVPAFNSAIIYLGLGDTDRTFEWLNKAVDDRSIRPWVMDPTFDAIRSDPRYGQLLRRLRLPARPDRDYNRSE